MQKILFISILSVACYFGHAQGKLTLQGDTLISLPGRTVLLNKQGFPQQISIQTDTGMTNLLAESIHFHFTRASDGKDIRMEPVKMEFTARKKNLLQWYAVIMGDDLTVVINGSINAKGEMTYTVGLGALVDIDLKDIPMHIPFQPDVAKEMSGLGQPLGPRPDSLIHWQWSGQSSTGKIWIGTPQVHLEYALQGAAWENNGKGSVVMGIKGKSMLANNDSGARTLHKGDDTLNYEFLLYLGSR